MKIYLDNCAYNRPFDNQKDIRIKIETEAKLYIQEQIKNNNIELIWSYILDLENSSNPFEERKLSISRWSGVATVDVQETEKLLQNAKKLTKIGLKAKDALHVASAIEAKAEYFLTTNDKILNKSGEVSELSILNPTEFIAQLKDD